MQSARRARTTAYVPDALDALWDLRHGDLDAAARIIASTRPTAEPAASETEDAVLRRAEVAILDAALGQARQSANASQLLALADTSGRGYALSPEWSLLLSEILERAGKTEAALAALDRSPSGLAAPLPQRLVDRLRAEGRLAAQLGQRERAARAYRTYLLSRANPDPELIAERDQVRAELARLEGAR